MQLHAAKPIENGFDTDRDSDERGRCRVFSTGSSPETFRTSWRMLRRSHKPSPRSPLGISVGVRCALESRGETSRRRFIRVAHPLVVNTLEREVVATAASNSLTHRRSYWLESPFWLRSRSPAPAGPVDAAMFETAILVISTSQRALGGSLSSLSSNGFVFVTVISVA
jgi:hypothetical protein